MEEKTKTTWKLIAEAFLAFLGAIVGAFLGG